MTAESHTQTIPCRTEPDLGNSQESRREGDNKLLWTQRCTHSDRAGVKGTLMTTRCYLQNRGWDPCCRVLKIHVPCVWHTQTYGTATMQRCKKSSQWMGEVPCLTVALLRSSHPYLSAGGATAVGYSCLSVCRAVSLKK